MGNQERENTPKASFDIFNYFYNFICDTIVCLRHDNTILAN